MTADSSACIDATWKRYVPAQGGMSTDLKYLRFEKERVLSSSLLCFSPSVQNLSKQMDVSDCFNVNTFLLPSPLSLSLPSSLLCLLTLFVWRVPWELAKP